jgi:hypothetical protein
MTIRTFWILFLKILGIWLILSGFSIIPQFIGAFIFFGNDPADNTYGIIYIIILMLLTLGLYFIVLRLFVFKTNWLIDKLKLDKEIPEETIDLNLKLRTLLTIATIVIGGLIFVDGFPMLCKQFFSFIQKKEVLREDPEFSWIIFYSVKTLIGYLLMTNSKNVIEYFNKKTEEEEK